MDMFISLGSGRFGALVAALSSVMLGCAGCNEVTGSRPSSVSVLWRTSLSGRLAGSNNLPTTDGQRFFITGRGADAGVVAFDVQDGERLWSLNPFTQSLPVYLAVHNGRVFAAENVAFALDAATGRELWRTPLDADASLSQNAADAHAFYVGTRSHRVYALDVASGAPLWQVDLGPGWPYESLTKGISVSGDTVYATVERAYSQNGYYAAGIIVALDRTTGRELWRHQNGDGSSPRGIIGAPTVAGRLLLASDHRGNAFYAVDRFTGQQVWRVPTQAPKRHPSSLMASCMAPQSTRTSIPLNSRPDVCCGGRDPQWVEVITTRSARTLSSTISSSSVWWTGTTGACSA